MIFKLYLNKAVKNEMTFTILEAVYMGKGPTFIQTVSSDFHDLLTAWPSCAQQLPPSPSITGPEILLMSPDA